MRQNSIASRSGGALLLRDSNWSMGVPHSTRWHTSFGFVFLAVVGIGFGGWAYMAPIAGAVVTSGIFVATGQNKIVQHLEGGVIGAINVKEGDLVEPGQILVRLDETTPKTELQRLVLRDATLAAAEARSRAQIAQADRVDFPAALMARIGEPQVASIVASQALIFDAWRRNLESSVAVLSEGISAVQRKIDGTKTQREAVMRQLDLFTEELSAKTILLEKAMIRKPEVLALQRAQASAQGEIGRLDGDIGDAQERISRIEKQIQDARNAAVKTATEQLQSTLSEQNDVRERIRAAEGVLRRIDIKAPVRGTVVKLRYHTTGGVVESGKTILEIVPAESDLLIEAHVRPQDIDNVRRGQGATVRLTAMSQRLTPMVAGEVVYVSADALPDERRAQTGDTYVARIKLDPEEASRLRHFSPTPGMPAEVYIKTSERTFFDYLTKPIRDSMTRAFREI